MNNDKISYSGEYLNNIINSVADPIFVKDDQFRFVLVNDALCKMLGISRENIIGKNLGESLPKDQMDHFLAVDREVLDSGQENVNEELLTGQGGKILDIITKKTRYVDEKGKKFLVGVIRDITERKNVDKILNEKIEELEKLNKLMVGRELEMVTMKEKLKNLDKL